MENAKKTLIEMINQREYKICSKTEDVIIGEKKCEDKIIVFLDSVEKFNVDRFKEYIGKLEQMNEDNNNRSYNHCIVVYEDCITPMGKKMIADSPDVIFELFSVDELQFNITKHRLVPLHKKLSEEKAKSFKQLYGLKHQAIFLTDPIARFYNYTRGDVIQITRPNSIIAYRIVKG